MMTEEERAKYRAKLAKQSEQAQGLYQGQKRCPSCQSVIPENYDICPICGHAFRPVYQNQTYSGPTVGQQKTKYRHGGSTPESRLAGKWWFWCIVMGILMILFVMGGTKSAWQEPSELKVERAPLVTEGSDEQQERREDGRYKQGDVVVLDTVQMKILEVNPDFTDYDADSFFTPDEDEKYVQIKAEFTNLVAEDQTIWGMDFNCFADGSMCDMAQLGGASSSIVLSEGDTDTLTVTFEVPKDATDMEIRYDDLMGNEEVRIDV